MQNLSNKLSNRRESTFAIPFENHNQYFANLASTWFPPWLYFIHFRLIMVLKTLYSNGSLELSSKLPLVKPDLHYD